MENGLEIPDGAKIRCGAVWSMTPPPEVVRFLARYGGLNLFGEPNYRLVWGGNRLHWRTKKFTDKDSNGNIVKRTVECRYRPKYPKYLQHWILEWWKAPYEYEGGDRELWFEHNTIRHDDQLIVPKQSFPSRGDYEFLDVITDVDGEGYAYPEIPLVKHAIDRHRKLTYDMNRVDFEYRAEEMEKRAYQRDVLNIYHAIKDQTAPSAHEPWVSLA